MKFIIAILISFLLISCAKDKSENGGGEASPNGSATPNGSSYNGSPGPKPGKGLGTPNQQAVHLSEYEYKNLYQEMENSYIWIFNFLKGSDNRNYYYSNNEIQNIENIAARCNASSPNFLTYLNKYKANRNPVKRHLTNKECTDLAQYISFAKSYQTFVVSTGIKYTGRENNENIQLNGKAISFEMFTKLNEDLIKSIVLLKRDSSLFGYTFPGEQTKDIGASLTRIAYRAGFFEKNIHNELEGLRFEIDEENKKQSLKNEEENKKRFAEHVRNNKRNGTNKEFTEKEFKEREFIEPLLNDFINYNASKFFNARTKLPIFPEVPAHYIVYPKVEMCNFLNISQNECTRENLNSSFKKWARKSHSDKRQSVLSEDEKNKLHTGFDLWDRYSEDEKIMNSNS